MRLLFAVEPIIPAWQEKLISNCCMLFEEQTLIILIVNRSNHSNISNKYSEFLVEKLSCFLLDRREIDPDAFSSINPFLHFKDHEAIHIIDQLSAPLPESDIIINLSPGLDEKKLAQETGRPIWGFRFGDSACINNPLATSHKLLSCSPTTSLKIIETTPDQNDPNILHKAASSTILDSARINTCQLAWKAAECTPRLFNKIAQTSRSLPSAPALTLENIIPECKIPPEATNINNSMTSYMQLSKRFLSQAANKIKSKYSKKQWVLAIGKQSSPLANPDNLTIVLPPKDRIWADPHLFEYQGQDYIFFEELLSQKKKGRICCAPIDDRGLSGKTVPVLERDYHLSYPFVFQKDGEILMIPESADNQTIELYKCRRFPDQWDYQGDLMQGVIAYDTTLLHHNGYWWLFANMSPIKGISSWDQLHLYYAGEFPTDAWIPHPANPVIDDVRYARPAGRIFKENDRLFRPSQDSAGGYGRSLNLQEIIELTPEKYSETQCWKWMPHHFSRHAFGVHTYSRLNERISLDILINRYLWSHKKKMHLQPKCPSQEKNGPKRSP